MHVKSIRNRNLVSHCTHGKRVEDEETTKEGKARYVLLNKQRTRLLQESTSRLFLLWDNVILDDHAIFTFS